MPRKIDSEPVVLERGQAEVLAQTQAGAQLDAHVEDGLDLGVEQVAAQPVRRDPEDHHAPRLPLRLEHDRPVAVRREVVRAGEPGRTCADDRHALVTRRRAGRGGGYAAAPVSLSTPKRSQTYRFSARIAIG